MSVVNAVLDVILAPGFLDNVNAMSKRLRAGLAELVKKYPGVVTEVRGSGLMIGLKVTPPNGDVVAALTRHGMLTVPAGDNVVRLLPPLTIGAKEADEALAIVEATCKALAAQPAAVA
jgi:acetylornithine/N-succinyldiaminopimelate aminotransferase